MSPMTEATSSTTAKMPSTSAATTTIATTPIPTKATTSMMQWQTPVSLTAPNLILDGSWDSEKTGYYNLVRVQMLASAKEKISWVDTASNAKAEPHCADAVDVSGELVVSFKQSTTVLCIACDADGIQSGVTSVSFTVVKGIWMTVSFILSADAFQQGGDGDRLSNAQHESLQNRFAEHLGVREDQVEVTSASLGFKRRLLSVSILPDSEEQASTVSASTETLNSSSISSIVQSSDGFSSAQVETIPHVKRDIPVKDVPNAISPDEEEEDATKVSGFPLEILAKASVVAGMFYLVRVLAWIPFHRRKFLSSPSPKQSCQQTFSDAASSKPNAPELAPFPTLGPQFSADSPCSSCPLSSCSSDTEHLKARVDELEWLVHRQAEQLLAQTGQRFESQAPPPTRESGGSGWRMAFPRSPQPPPRSSLLAHAPPPAQLPGSTLHAPHSSSSGDLVTAGPPTTPPRIGALMPETPFTPETSNEVACVAESTEAVRVRLLGLSSVVQ